MTLTLQARDAQNNPVQAEFSISLVDAAVLALADPNAQDILSAYYGQQPLGVRTGLALAAYGRRTAAMAGGNLLQLSSRAAPRYIAQNEPVITFNVPDLPDYALDSAVPSATILTSGTPLSVDVGVVNHGSDGVQGLIVAAAWDGPPGTGLPAGTATLVGPAAGQLANASLSIDTSGVNLSQPHQLFIAVNPEQAVPEASVEDNSSVLEIGGLPAPAGLTASAKPGSSLVFLSWNAPLDARVIGYRIYRFDSSRVVIPVGSSFEPDFAERMYRSLDSCTTWRPSSTASHPAAKPQFSTTLGATSARSGPCATYPTGPSSSSSSPRSATAASVESNGR